MFRDHEFLGKGKAKYSNSSNVSRDHPLDEGGNKHYQPPIQKRKHHRNFNQDFINIAPPLSVRKSNHSNEGPLNFLTNFKERKQQTKYKNTIKFNENSQIDAEWLERQFKRINLKLLNHQKQIQDLKAYEVQYMKKQEFKELTSVFRDYKNIINQVSETTTNQITTIKGHIQNIYCQIGKIKKITLLPQSITQKDNELINSNNMKGYQIYQLEIKKITTTAKQQINETINQLLETSKNCIKEYLGNQHKIFTRSNIFASRSIQLVHEECLIVREQQQNEQKTVEEKQQNKERKCIIISQKIYHIDSEGFLLDFDKCYLIDTKNKLVRLNEKEIEALKKINIFQIKT